MNDISEYPIEDIRGSGYVIQSLEASLWCFLTEDAFKDSVLKAVNLGEDTDTTAAITGGLSGIYYGLEGIPSKWIEKTARKDDILSLGDRLKDKYFPNIRKKK